MKGVAMKFLKVMDGFIGTQTHLSQISVFPRISDTSF